MTSLKVNVADEKKDQEFTISLLSTSPNPLSFTPSFSLLTTPPSPDGLVVCHLPYGPTASFSLSNTVMRHDIPNVGTMSEAFPHLIFHNFKTKLGERVSPAWQGFIQGKCTCMQQAHVCVSVPARIS